jgi:cytidine deaminase
MTTETSIWTSLIRAAIQAAENAYAPYSHYRVGAALMTESGKVYQGCNVENAAYGSSICAERTAILKAVSEGERAFKAIAVATQNGGTPCGSCRQVMREFATDMTVIITDFDGNARLTSLQALLPDSFGPENLPAPQS